MALVRKGSRRITVDGVTCRWRAGRRPTYDQALVRSPLTYAVEQPETPGTVLVVTTGRPHPGNWLGIPARPVLDATAAATIRTSRARGRTPGESARPFLLDMSQGFTRAD